MIVRILIEINLNMAHIGFISSLMVFILVMKVINSRTIPEEGSINMVNEFECRSDKDCEEKNTYCDVGLNLCSQCVNCSIYFRTQKKNIKCPTDISDCNNCLEGYFEETFFGGETRDTCVPIDSNNVLPTPAKISSNSYWQDVVIIFMTFNILLICVLWTYFYKRASNSSVNNISNILEDGVENQPPSYNSCMKLNNYVTDDVQEFHLFTGEQPPRNEWRHQNAVPFRLVEDSLETNSQMDVSENTEEIDGVVTRDIEDPELHDEETMPSLWTPLPQPLPPSLPELIHTQNDNSQTDSPPCKRKRLEQHSTDEKSYSDEDNASDVSQDEF